ncbi:MAG: hypothetical protein UR69_C0002G0273 [Candidatus Moranbacteria bacterium GW2011_GWE2_35_2-]|nr:MAG: hypothetical protein UR69_C0002G0273 [Candidatus Moranbacteria bacterium GW2011_GWE2_35_2-]KKQ06038.1 MAG: hypothetical protein US15_C0022G0009 [Candidatus Moranbacteria bacterium GW2011_GWF1_36_4]KKQ22381.1 MAG: hypothetical protein US37_C0002G0006 [Candidatus Moranbacteria bacterium GW2011_GWF2_37_11]KKQ29449.1 MAG: hypothetical protein US44_C0001G0041 [Candidatus Moranbacteria bacterium GW2011_GWD1_37_17]KKQ30683.1 MAG: hypothetical protein US47_C0002G0273 [Candidatus Moranbacteria b
MIYEMMKNKLREIGLALVIIALSGGAWFLLHQSVINSSINDWIVPGIFFSAVFVFWIVAVILIKKTSHIATVFFLSLIPSLFFVFDIGHFLVLSIAFLFLLMAATRIERELTTSVKINLWRTVRLGRIMMVFALSLAISSHYYFEIKNNNAHHNIPDFNLGNANEKIITKVVSFIYPEIDFSEENKLTVDEFILQAQQKKMNTDSDDKKEIEGIIAEQFGENITEQQKKEIIENYQNQSEEFAEKNNELILRKGRKQISDLIKRPVRGDEEVASVFSQMISTKIEDFINFDAGKSSYGSASYLPVILTFLLFLSILSFGSFFGPLWVMLAQVIFWLMVKLRWVKINKIMVEQEVIE